MQADDVREKEFSRHGRENLHRVRQIVFPRHERMLSRASFPAVIGLMIIGLLPIAGVGANQSHDRLAAMSELDRSETLAIFVESSGHACRTVARTFYQGADAKKNAFWNVECSGGESYLVQIKNDAVGSTRVINCRRLQALGGSACFKKLE